MNNSRHNPKFFWQGTTHAFRSHWSTQLLKYYMAGYWNINNLLVKVLPLPVHTRNEGSRKRNENVTSKNENRKRTGLSICKYGCVVSVHRQIWLRWRKMEMEMMVVVVICFQRRYPVMNDFKSGCMLSEYTVDCCDSLLCKKSNVKQRLFPRTSLLLPVSQRIHSRHCITRSLPTSGRT